MGNNAEYRSVYIGKSNKLDKNVKKYSLLAEDITCYFYGRDGHPGNWL